MGPPHQKSLFPMKYFAIYFFLSQSLQVSARPAPQDPFPGHRMTEGPAPVTSVVTSDGAQITQTFTPTAVSVSGLAPPITKAITIATTDSAARGLMVAIPVGAGIVAGGALAGWLFKPIPGAPPAPTEPTPYPTEEQEQLPSKTTNDLPKSTTTTTNEPSICPFKTVNAEQYFTHMPLPPKWTGPECTKQWSNSRHLLRGTFPDYVKELAQVFCKSDLSKDQSRTLGREDLPDGAVWKNRDIGGINVRFGFDFKKRFDACPKNCVDAYNTMLQCRFNSHTIYGGASLMQGCGKYSFAIEVEPILRLECSPPGIENSQYRDAAIEMVDNFCAAQDGRVIKAKDKSSFIRETSFTVQYEENCSGPDEYKITKDLCRQYLTRTIDGCHTNSVLYKKGGTLTDEDDCISFIFHPKGYDAFSCNKDNGIAQSKRHAAISPAIAEHAMNKFCDRKGDGQTYTLDPNVAPNLTGFTQNICKEPGMASCSYFYKYSGEEVELGQSDFSLSLSASYDEPGGYQCGQRFKYEIQGERCKRMLRKLIGVEPEGMCVGSDPNKLDLGDFLESGDKGCVRWSMFAQKPAWGVK
ncbi:hypothetical protein AJ79_05306 [Helicocarpus griseus UAMH5409]|uniref:Uncharacterized protein n=1 Tax=Helicocarpus griseus UAMH5409 TaxID=1447875 RepID=A0A2B7XP49_9EURO|nr:hypothetical protein AJ79_05306 [Helicocarpus griseus UAMH5409]